MEKLEKCIYTMVEFGIPPNVDTVHGGGVVPEAQMYRMLIHGSCLIQYASQQ